MYICWINIIEFNRTTYTIYYCSSLKCVNKVRSTTLSAIDLQTINISVGTNLSLVTLLYLFLGGRTFQLHRLLGYSINIKTLPEVQFDSLKTKSTATLSSSNIVLLMNRQEGIGNYLVYLKLVNLSHCFITPDNVNNWKVHKVQLTSRRNKFESTLCACLVKTIILQFININSLQLQVGEICGVFWE